VYGDGNAWLKQGWCAIYFGSVGPRLLAAKDG